MESYTPAEGASVAEHPIALLSEEERAQINEAMMFGQISLMWVYAKAHLPTGLDESKREQEIQRLEQQWSDGTSERNKFSRITRGIVQHACRLDERSSLAREDIEALKFTRNLLALGRRELVPRQTQGEYQISQEGEALANGLQEYLNKVAETWVEGSSVEG